MKISRVLAMTLMATTLMACGGGSGDSPGVVTTPPIVINPDSVVNNNTMKVASSVFVNGGNIPLEHWPRNMGGQNLSLPLYWSNVPAGTKSFIVYMDSVTGVNKNQFTHWTVYNIPVTTTSISTNEDLSKIPGVLVGVHSQSKYAYEGPNSANKDSVYTLTVYAMSDKMTPMVQDWLPNVAITREQLEKEYKDSIIAKASIVSGKI